MIEYLSQENKRKLQNLNLPNYSNEIKLLICEKYSPHGMDFLKSVGGIFTNKKDIHADWVSQVIQMINPKVKLYYYAPSNIPEAVEYAIANNIKIINMSFAGFSGSDRVEALKKYYEWGGVAICGSGNNANRSVQFPASSEYTIAVAGINVESSASKELDVYVEGNYYVRQLSENMYHFFDGTSGCAPIITGCVSLLLKKYPNWNCEDVRKFLKDNSKQFNEYAGVFKFPDDFDKEVEEMNNPDKIIIHHSATKDGEIKNFDGIRNYHVNVNKWADIGYHYVVENVNGKYVTLKGRAEEVAGVHCPGQNNQSIAICLVGDFRKGNPPQEQLKEVARLIKDIYARHGELPLYKHSDFRATECPAFDLKLITDLLVTKEENVTMWQEKQGLEHLENLVKKKIIDTPDFWKSKMLEPTPVWLTLSLIDRITDK